MNSYGIKTWLALALTIVPAYQVYDYCGTIDTYPYLMCLVVGSVISAFLGFRRLRQKDALASHVTGTDEYFRAYETRQAKTILLFAGPPLWAFALLLAANRWFDQAPALNHSVRFVDFRIQKKAGSTVVVESWRHPGQSESLRYDWRRMRDISASLPRGQRVTVAIRKGALGWPWLESMTLAPPNDTATLDSENRR